MTGYRTRSCHTDQRSLLDKKAGFVVGAHVVVNGKNVNFRRIYPMRSADDSECEDLDGF